VCPVCTFNNHQLMHINFIHNSLFLEFPYTYFGGLNRHLQGVVEINMHREAEMLQRDESSLCNNTTPTSRSSLSTYRWPPYCKTKLPLIFRLTTNYVNILATFNSFYSNLFYILYEVDIISPLIFYIYKYNHICNNCKSMHINLYDPLKMVV
jgi:hypothetical protein